MAKETFNYGNLKITVEDVGEGVATWDKERRPRIQYKISVKGPGSASFRTDGWGSINDYENGEKDHRGMAWSAIMDLVSAAADPDDFMSTVIGDSPGREAADRVRAADKVIKAAKKFKWEDLEAANNQAQEEGA